MHPSRPGLSLAFIVFLFPPAVAAQHTPGIEIAIGYSYLRLSTDSGFNPAHLNGWDASVKLDVTPGIQLVAEFGGNYGHRVLAPYTLFLPIPGDPNPLIQTRPGALHQHSFLFGPEIRVLHRGRLTVSARTLLGAANRNTLVLPLVTPIQLPFGPDGSSVTFSHRTVPGGNPFAAALGGALDYRITNRLSCRIAQPEILLTNFAGATPLNLRISSGIVYTAGKSVPPDSSERRIAFGVVAGASLTDGFRQQTAVSFATPAGAIETDRTLFHSAHKDPIAGPMVEIALAPHWSTEMDGLYRPLNFAITLVRSNQLPAPGSPSTVVTWEFPILAKYRIAAGPAKPFLEAGPSFRSSGNLNGTAPSSYGGTAGLGLEAHAGPLKIAPVVRFTHWAGEGLYQPHTRRNQVELLLGVSF